MFRAGIGAKRPNNGQSRTVRCHRRIVRCMTVPYRNYSWESKSKAYLNKPGQNALPLRFHLSVHALLLTSVLCFHVRTFFHMQLSFSHLSPQIYPWHAKIRYQLGVAQTSKLAKNCLWLLPLCFHCILCVHAASVVCMCAVCVGRREAAGHRPLDGLDTIVHY
jgi:hypothetical protein